MGGANTDYTAVDYNHMLLALALPQVLAHANGPNSGVTLTGNGLMDGVSVPIPSLHRADLIQYWLKKASASSFANLANNNPALARAICFRPNPYDHPAFCQNVNPNFNAGWDGQWVNSSNGTYHWDVDNMGTGYPDSIWVDLGFPVRPRPTAASTSRCLPFCAWTSTAA